MLSWQCESVELTFVDLLTILMQRNSFVLIKSKNIGVMESNLSRQAKVELQELLENVSNKIVENQRPANETLLDDDDVMDRLKICKRKLASLRADGTIPYSKIGRKIIYKWSDILEVVERNRSPSTKDKLRLH